jgi:GTP-binding protein
MPRTTSTNTKIAIIGRPNVGKSTLFNAFTKTRDALVHNRPGVTRDVIEGNRNGMTFMDTAGLENAGGGISKDSTDFALAAAKNADVVLFVVDGRAGLQPMDIEWARLVKVGNKKQETCDRKIILLANKCESKKGADNLHEFYKLGFGEPFPVSAEHNIGLNEVLSELQTYNHASHVTHHAPRITIMGQPNVGKSTLINQIAGARRVLVRDEPGITRDVIKISAHYLGRDIEIMDTAGLRKKSRVDNDVETLAALKTLDALGNTDAVILVIDATKTIEKQAIQIAERIYDAGKILCVALNKWDLVPADEKDDRLMRLKHLFADSHNQIIKPMIVPISAEKGTGVKNMMKHVYELLDKSNARAPTSLVNRAVEKLVSAHQPPMSRLKRPMKIKFASHTGLHPNTITINVGGASDIPESYTRYLRRGISEKLGWESIPVVIQYVKEENPFN